MTRAELTAYLANVFSSLLAQAGIGTLDVITGLKYPVDAAYRRIGTAEADIATATTTAVEAVQTLGEYYTLRQIQKALANRVEFDATAISGDARSPVFDNVTAMLADAENRCKAVGYAVVGSEANSAAYGLTTLYTGYIEPEVTA